MTDERHSDPRQRNQGTPGWLMAAGASLVLGIVACTCGPSGLLNTAASPTELPGKQFPTQPAIEDPATVPPAAGAAQPEGREPDEIYSELFWGGAGANATPPPSCDSGTVTFWIETQGGAGLINGDPDHPYFLAPPPEEGVYGLEFIINQCNLLEGVPVDLTFTLPDGQQERVPAQTGPGWNLDVSWISLPGEPAGQYQVHVSTQGYENDLIFTVSRALYPIVNVICNGYGQGVHNLLLTGFQPGEEVLLIWYVEVPLSPEEQADSSKLPFGSKWVIDSYRTITMDGEGTGSLELNGSEGMIVAVGENPQYYWAETTEFESPPVDGFDGIFCF